MSFLYLQKSLYFPLNPVSLKKSLKTTFMDVDWHELFEVQNQAAHTTAARSGFYAVFLLVMLLLAIFNRVRWVPIAVVIERILAEMIKVIRDRNLQDMFRCLYHLFIYTWFSTKGLLSGEPAIEIRSNSFSTCPWCKRCVPSMWKAWGLRTSRGGPFQLRCQLAKAVQDWGWFFVL